MEPGRMAFHKTFLKEHGRQRRLARQFSPAVVSQTTKRQQSGFQLSVESNFAFALVLHYYVL